MAVGFVTCVLTLTSSHFDVSGCHRVLGVGREGCKLNVALGPTLASSVWQTHDVGERLNKACLCWPCPSWVRLIRSHQGVGSRLIVALPDSGLHRIEDHLLEDLSAGCALGGSAKSGRLGRLRMGIGAPGIQIWLGFTILDLGPCNFVLSSWSLHREQKNPGWGLYCCLWSRHWSSGSRSVLSWWNEAQKHS